MAFPIAVGEKLELRIYCWNNGAKQLGINTVRLRVASATPGGPIDSQELSEELSGMLAPLYKDLLDSSCEYLGISIQDFPYRLWYPEYSNNAQGAGLVVGNDAPSQASGLISFRTLYGKPSGRGRIYIPFPSVTSNGADGLPITDYVEDLQVLANFFAANIPVALTTQSVVLVGIIANSVGSGPTKDITNAIGVKKWATQRRRGSYGRQNVVPTELQPD